MSRYAYLRDPAAIYRQSFETVNREVDFSPFSADQKPLVQRLVHACGLPEVAARLSISPGLVGSATQALQAGAPILCDCEMVAAGITRRFLGAGNEILVTLNDPQVPALAKQLATTRSAAAVDLWLPRLAGAVVAIGNAPTALFALLEYLHEADTESPAAILAFPVGFVGAAESKQALVEAGLNVPYAALLGRQGGSALASAAVNALALSAFPAERSAS